MTEALAAVVAAVVVFVAALAAGLRSRRKQDQAVHERYARQHREARERETNER